MQAEARVQEESYQSQLRYLQGLKELGVDVTKVGEGTEI
jgi:hypothetical protein